MGQNKKKKITLLDCYNRLRKVWKINPKTKVKKSDKKYNRNKEKQRFRRELKNNKLSDL